MLRRNSANSIFPPRFELVRQKEWKKDRGTANRVNRPLSLNMRKGQAHSFRLSCDGEDEESAEGSLKMFSPFVSRQKKEEISGIAEMHRSTAKSVIYAVRG